jgi:hypothetical protein
MYSPSLPLQLNAGADPGFQVRGGALKKIAPSGGRPENCWGISMDIYVILYLNQTYH